jgi:hypothetical protein
MIEYLQRFGVGVVWMVEPWHKLAHTHFHGEVVVVVWVVQHPEACATPRPQGQLRVFCTTSRYHTPATCLSVLVVRIQVFGVHANVYFVGNLQQAQSLRPQLPTTLTHHTTLINGQHEQD